MNKTRCRRLNLAAGAGLPEAGCSFQWQEPHWLFRSEAAQIVSVEILCHLHFNLSLVCLYMATGGESETLHLNGPGRVHLVDTRHYLRSYCHNPTQRLASTDTNPKNQLLEEPRVGNAKLSI
jgi:hypothetical protein